MNDLAQEPLPTQPQGREHEKRFRNSVPDWTFRALIFVVFLYFGTAKFKSDPGAPWVVLFDQIGLGQWLRYFTGGLEMVGAFLVLVSGTVEIGLAILCITMFGAMIATLLILHEPSYAFFPFAFLTGMIAFWLHRRRV
jgi:putative oxidoreductase